MVLRLASITENDLLTLMTLYMLLLCAGLENMNAAELELVVAAKLQLAAIAQQRHHAAMAARIVFSALKILQNAAIFKERKPEFSSPKK